MLSLFWHSRSLLRCSSYHLPAKQYWVFPFRVLCIWEVTSSLNLFKRVIKSSRPPTVRTISPPKMQTQIATSCERTMLESKRTREACKQANCSKKVSRAFSKFGEGTSLGTPCQVPNRRQPNSILHLSRLVNSHTHHQAEKRRPQHKNQIHIKKIDRVPIKSPPEIKL